MRIQSRATGLRICTDFVMSANSQQKRHKQDLLQIHACGCQISIIAIQLGFAGEKLTYAHGGISNPGDWAIKEALTLQSPRFIRVIQEGFPVIGYRLAIFIDDDG